MFIELLDEGLCEFRMLLLRKDLILFNLVSIEFRRLLSRELLELESTPKLLVVGGDENRYSVEGRALTKSAASPSW